MALADAIALIADQMDDDALQAEQAPLSFYARQLRTVIKAADGGNTAPPAQQAVPELQHFLEIEKARVEMRKQKKMANLEESHDNYATCVGGKSDGTLAPIADMPVGAKTIIDGEVYELKGGKLVFVVKG